MNKVKIEYDGSRKHKFVEQKVKRPGGRTMTDRVKVAVKDPRCWEVITIENSILYMPGQRLTRKQVEALCRGDRYEVEIGQSGQFKTNHSRY